MEDGFGTYDLAATCGRVMTSALLSPCYGGWFVYKDHMLLRNQAMLSAVAQPIPPRKITFALHTQAEMVYLVL